MQSEAALDGAACKTNAAFPLHYCHQDGHPSYIIIAITTMNFLFLPLLLTSSASLLFLSVTTTALTPEHSVFCQGVPVTMSRMAM